MERAEELGKLKKLQKDLRLGKKISEADADSYYDLLDKLEGLSLARVGDSYCLCNARGEKIESVELINKTLQPLIASAEAAVTKQELSPANQPNFTTTMHINRANFVSNAFSMPSTSHEPPPAYSVEDQEIWQNQNADNTQASQTVSVEQTLDKAVETKQDNNFGNKAVSNQPSPQAQTTISASTSSAREQKHPPVLDMLTQFKGVVKPPNPHVNPSNLTAFLRLVAEGEQDKAEAMLKSNPALALVPGDVTDLSKRIFIGITAFQYAVWALDWHMWTMIRKYLPDEVALEQAQGFETGAWIKDYGVHAKWILDKLLNAYDVTLGLYDQSKWAEGDTAWIQQVGGTQLLLPAHVINEYCHPKRPFNPLPNFSDSLALPRTRTINESEWFTATLDGGKLGEKFAAWRSSVSTCRMGGRWGAIVSSQRLTFKPQPSTIYDRSALFALSGTRTAQREELIAGLRSIVLAVQAHKISYLAAAGAELKNAVETQSSEAPCLTFLAQQSPRSVHIHAVTTVPNIDPKDIANFLTLVAEGEQDQAEAMLKRNSDLALAPGDVTDLSKRTFKNITGFQYAVWALDWHMWAMIRKYLPDEAAKEQARGFETGAWVKEHGIHAQHLLDNLAKALQVTIDLYNDKKYGQGDIAWVQQVGGAQFLLPAHVINEYCHPHRPFYPLPNFKSPSALPRIRKLAEGEWFTAKQSASQQSLGTTFAVVRGQSLAAIDYETVLAQPLRALAISDMDSIQALSITRKSQRVELIFKLSPKHVQMEVAQVSASDLKEFLELVAEGEQDKAEAMLQNKPALALFPGDVTDLSKRTFSNITAFQYAVWALDWHMWKMIRKYLPDDAAQEQARGFETGPWIRQHGISAKPLLEKLINALETTVALQNAGKDDEVKITWVQQVGGVQLLLPAHVINEYCHSKRQFQRQSRSFSNFRDDSVLPRSRLVDAGEWFTAVNHGGKLGETFAMCLGQWSRRGGESGGARAVPRGPGWGTVGGVRQDPPDISFARALTSTRTIQREEIIAQLKTGNVQKRAM